jgi:hypothetical protein
LFGGEGTGEEIIEKNYPLFERGFFVENDK